MAISAKEQNVFLFKFFNLAEVKNSSLRGKTCALDVARKKLIDAVKDQQEISPTQAHGISEPEVIIEDDSRPGPSRKKKKSILELAKSIRVSEAIATTAVLSKKSEADIYLDEMAVIDLKQDPLIFWKENASRLPALSALARRFLSIPASSGAVERLFSVTGSIQRARRSNLEPRVIEYLLMLRESSSFN
jgi:hypothetical protein